MTKILLITLEYPPQIGGIATYCHDLVMALETNKVVVLAPGGKDMYSTEKQKLAWDKKQSYKIIRKKMLFPIFIWPRWLRLCWQVWRITKKEKIEMIFVQHSLPVGYAAMFVKKLTKVPYLLFSHGTDLVAGTSTGWKKKMITKIASDTEQIIFNSESLKRRFLRVLGDFKSKSLVLYPCPEPAFLQSPPQDQIDQLKAQYALEGKQVLLTISRLDEGKGFPQLINYMPSIIEKSPHIVWFIIGGGKKSDLIHKMILEKNLQNIVRFIGEIPHMELQKYYYLADLFALLTHPNEGKEEGLGLVFLEASAAGLPIVAGRSGGVEEAVLHNKTGLIVDTYNGPECSNAISELLNDRKQAKVLGDAAKDRVLRDFQWNQQVKKLNPWLQS
jgi:phosphatidyl-myo-inositol dimannoside synthase